MPPSCPVAPWFAALAVFSLPACGARSDLPPAEPPGAGPGAAPACLPGDAPAVLAADLTWPFGIVVDATSVYFTTYEAQGAVTKVPKAGGAAVVLADGLDFPDQLVLDGADLYVTVGGAGSILRLAVDGSAMETVVSGLDGPSGLAADASSLYWAAYFGDSIGEAAKSGGPATVLATPMSPYRIAAGPAAVYWSSFGPDVEFVSKSGGPVLTIPSGGEPRTLAVFGPRLYWTDSKAQELHSAALDGTDPQTLASVSSFADGIAVDDAHVYAALAGGDVVRIPQGGGAPVTLASGPVPTLIAVDEACVYWTNTGEETSGTGVVMRAPK